MTYNPTLVQVQASIGGYAVANTSMNFPTVPFNYLLFSMWTCSPKDHFGHANGGPAYINFFTLDAGLGVMTLANLSTATPFFQGTFHDTSAGVRSNHLVSVDCAHQIVQYYINDVPTTLTSGGWLSAGHFQTTVTANIWDFDVGDGFGTQQFPAFGDIWMWAPGSFFDLSVIANRRRFIGADLSPVDLGPTGALPTGTRPQMFQTILSGDAPLAFMTNRGTGISFHKGADTTLAFQPDGACFALVPTFLPGVAGVGEAGTITDVAPPRLDLADFVVTERISADPELSLRWSDTRGASWSSWIRKAFTTTGEYDIDIAFYRLGLARDRIWEVSWATPSATALTGAFISYEIAGS